jgi:hypothetical protein
MKRATLEIYYQDGKTEIRQLEDGKYTVGRESSDIVLNNTVISGLHGEILVSGSSVTYTDMGSTNGSFVNGKRLTEPFTMSVGSEIKLGDCKIVLKALNAPAAATVLQSAIPAGSEGTAGSAGDGNASSDAGVGSDKPAQSAAIVSDGGHQSSSSDGRKYTLDIGSLLKGATQDKDWILKSLFIGLMTLVPIAGIFNFLGWSIACYRARRDGATVLPPAKFIYIRDGFRLFVAYLPAIAAFIAVHVIIGILGSLFYVFALLGLLIYLALLIYIWVAAPAIMYLFIEKNEAFASMQIAKINDLMRSDSNSYMHLWLAFLVAGVISSLGGIVFIGGILTIPFGAVVQSFALADWGKTKE